MRKLLRMSLALTVGIGLMLPSSAQAAVSKPSSPSIASITSSVVKKGKVTITVRISLPASNGGSKITGSKVFAGGKSCTIKKLKTSCKIRNIKDKKLLNIVASSKNKKGFGPRSNAVSFVAGSKYSSEPINETSSHSHSQNPTPQASATPSASTGVTTFNVRNDRAVSYIINGQTNPTLTVIRGVTYTFEVNAQGHPFWLQSTSGAYSVSSNYSPGVLRGGAQEGTITWQVPMNAPDTLYYVCQYHSSQNGSINVVNPS